ncbi:low molecular weight phosphotyrosine protein phosphatase [Paenibacillus sp. 1011MAR3C5]|uniref:low molecular weight protein-tyrosine-phosphatase n=1 Tax=Paenibacillus sp. 1011MAR3C5 TaxID=1675787 RepID=UPI000E6CA64F|nr:low molecular weight protein-tyrosine-phosphatase [Paenibacillus sp. 1011MAR3C5]RJE90190.1 low molecular weight phosphotyrosine protein phosphatase [Paenibacillus sp. 1011MAR3C5]
MEHEVRVLFVCLGNICRSPMAEAVMRKLIMEKGLENRIAVDSAGTGDWHIGREPHEGTRGVLDAHGISYAGMKARQVSPQDAADFHYIVCMDQKNLKDAREMMASAVGENTSGKVFTFMELLPDRGVVDVPDPYYEGNFDYVYELVNEGCHALLDKIKADIGLSV